MVTQMPIFGWVARELIRKSWNHGLRRTHPQPFERNETSGTEAKDMALFMVAMSGTADARKEAVMMQRCEKEKAHG